MKGTCQPSHRQQLLCPMVDMVTSIRTNINSLDIIIHRGPSGLSWASIVPSALIYGAFLAALAQKQLIQTKIPVKWLYAAFIGFAILVTISTILLNDRVLRPAISTGAWAVALVLCLVAHRRKQD